MKRIDILIGIGCVVFASVALDQSLALDFFQRSGIPGPGFFPTFLAIAIGAIGLMLVVSRLVGDAARFGEFSAPSPTELGRALAVWLALVFAAFALQSVGFVVTSVVLIAVLLLGVERLRTRGALLTVILLPVACYAIFVLLLQVRLPAGPWGF